MNILWHLKSVPTPKEFAMAPTIPRRVFMISVASSAAAVATLAHAQAMVDEKDGTAAALGYVADAKRVDPKKQPKYAAGQLCSNCALYQGKATDKAAGCPLFAGKQVAGAGWCNAWAKKG
jgi:High potential iron-sulfur protein